MEEIEAVLRRVNKHLNDLGLEAEVEMEASLPVLFTIDGEEHEAEINIVISESGPRVPNIRTQLKEIAKDYERDG